MADDTGLEIEALNGEPGIHARRWRDGKTRMTDQEAIDYCLYKMEDVPKGKRHARFRTVITLAFSEKDSKHSTEFWMAKILQNQFPYGLKAYRLNRCFIFQMEAGLGEVHQMPVEKKAKLLTHREIAITKALPRIRELLSLTSVDKKVIIIN